MPPWPEIGIIHHESFDEPLHGPANQVINPAVYVESWSGYALNRTTSHVQPYLAPMLSSNSSFWIDPCSGAFRLWVNPAWSSLSTGQGVGPGSVATLLTLVSTNGNNSEIIWSLFFSPDGNSIQLVCESETGPSIGLSAQVSFLAGKWNLVTLGYTPTNSALYINDQLAATGGGFLSIPPNAAPYTSLVVGSDLSGGSVVSGQVEELSIFSGGRVLPRLNHPFGLEPDWEISDYYNSHAPTASLGPITDAELAAQAAERAASLAALQNAAPRMSALAMDNVTPATDALNGCGAGGPVYFTNFGCSFDPVAGWTVSFSIAGGTSGRPYEICMTTNLAPSDSTGHVQWSWLGRGYACNSYTFTGQPDAGAFYILGDATVDPDGDGLSTPYELWVSHTDPNSYTSLSSDGYGTPDAWYLAHGLNPLTPGIATQDANGNGVLNWQEYRRNADPTSGVNFGIWIGSPNGFSGIP